MVILQQNRNTLANTAKSDNDNIQVNKKAEKNLKKVNKIYLETIAKDIFEFSQSQTQKLHHIALKCPLEEGVAVYKARSMITFFTNVNYAAL
jgi:predicted GNAT family acetyltransferase